MEEITNNNTKKCLFCRENKTLQDFDSNTGVKCKECKEKTHLAYDKRNKLNRRGNPKYLQMARKSYYKYREKRLKSAKDYNNKNKEKLKQKQHDYYLINKDRILEQNRLYRQKPGVKERSRISNRLSLQRRKTANPNYLREKNKKYYKKNFNAKIAKNMRCRVWWGLHNQKILKTEHTHELVGCSWKFLKEYIEKQFYDKIILGKIAIKMSWENYGIGNGKWQIDHKIPCCQYDLNKKEERLKCFHYTNLQPLWHEDHYLKSRKDQEKSINKKLREENPEACVSS